MLKLSSGIKIDEDGVIEAIKCSDASVSHYLDAVTGQVGGVKQNSKKLSKNRYFKIAKVSESKEIKWAKSYVKELMDPKDKLSGKLLKSLQKGFDNFYKTIEKTDEIYGWPQWEQDLAYEEVENWIDTLPIDIANEWEWDCDCAICQAENFNQKFGRYPKPSELAEFMENQKNKKLV